VSIASLVPAEALYQPEAVREFQLARLRSVVDEEREATFRPPPSMRLPQWTDTYRKLAPDVGNIGGSWRTSRVEVARGPMMAVGEPGVSTITVMCCTQLMKTSLLENTFGYFVHLEPCPILIVEPKDEAVDQFSKERLVPMIRATPVLDEIFDERRTRRSGDTIRFKRFPGGFVALGAAGSPTNLAMRAIRIVLLDEIDKYEPTKEGDAVLLAEERMATFGSSALSIRACSPTWEETSRIGRSFESGDKRMAYVACPRCGHEQGLDFFRHVHWEKTQEGEHRPETAAIFCEQCNGRWEERERMALISKEGAIKWRQTKTFTCCGVKQDPRVERNWRWDAENQVGRATCKECGKDAVSNHHASFQASKLFSPFISMVDLAAKWIDSKEDPESKQTFYNTQLGVPFRVEAMKEVGSGGLLSRREKYQAEAPEGVLLLVAGVDVQTGAKGGEGRIEVEVVGFGVGEESWSIANKVFDGDPSGADLWRKVDEYLLRPWKHEWGFEMFVRAVCIDSGGHHTQEVYNFARSRTGRNVWAIKGASDRGGQWSPVWPGARKTESSKYRTGFRPIIIGVNAAKEAIRQRLLINEPGPGYCHFPLDDRGDGWYDQLVAERLVLERKHGLSIRRWMLPKGRANEALDTRVYAYAALQGLYIVRKLDLDRQAVTLEALRGAKPAAAEDGAEPHAPQPEAPAAAKPHRRKTRRSSFMG